MSYIFIKKGYVKTSTAKAFEQENSLKEGLKNAGII